MLIRSIEDSIKDHLMKGSGFLDSYGVPNMSDVMHHPLEDVTLFVLDPAMKGGGFFSGAREVANTGEMPSSHGGEHYCPGGSVRSAPAALPARQPLRTAMTAAAGLCRRCGLAG